ncbi:uncharacterized protein LOC124925135 [Impatiens glandulifera]|uniref:uncharacterized protein LOC124925135 n=1 Tax=Impatiens glandulifera TaxID=253017 RepID=UPI001FB17174|nr:uncharacterized protein LOC124925135 [Impatiens glandulifera]
MGNYASSCTYNLTMKMTKSSKSAAAARVIFPGGEIEQYREPINAAELMLDFPNFFLVNLRSINIGKRFQPLTADQYLEPPNIYVFFPMKRVHSLVTAADVAIRFMSSSSRLKNNTTKVSPEIECAVQEPRLSLDGIERSHHGAGIFICRSKKPTLDTIIE